MVFVIAITIKQITITAKSTFANLSDIVASLLLWVFVAKFNPSGYAVKEDKGNNTQNNY